MNALTSVLACLLALTACHRASESHPEEGPRGEVHAAPLPVGEGTPQMQSHYTPERRVLVNDRLLTDQQLRELEERYRKPIPNGSYWYDRMTGAWGETGGPTSGFVHPNLDVGGTLRADASHGDTGVFINGRELHRTDVQGLQRLGPVLPGRWWMDAAGNFGAEHGPWLGNIWLAARQSGALNGGHGGNAWVAYGKYGSGAIGSDANGQMFANFGDLSWPP